MKKQSPIFETDGTQPDYVRDLLDAGRDAAMNDPAVHGYDVEAGLARHAALVQAGAALPPWAAQMVASGTAGAAGTAAVAKLATGKLVAGIALAVVTAGAIATMIIGAPEEAAHVAPAPAPVLPPPAPEAAQLPSALDQARGQEQQAAAPGEAPVGEAIELDVVPITTRGKHEAQHEATSERTAAGEVKPSRSGSAQSAKSLDALMNAVGKPASSSKGHVDVVAPSETVARSEQARAGQSAEAEQAATPAPAPAVDDARLEREMGMLAVAQRVLKSDPERALRLAQQGEKEFSGSMFTQERQQVLLLALIELGRNGEAKRLAQPYLKRWPNGPFSDRLRSALAAAKSEN